MYVQYAGYTCMYNMQTVHVCTICRLYMYVQYEIYIYTHILYECLHEHSCAYHASKKHRNG